MSRRRVRCFLGLATLVALTPLPAAGQQTVVMRQAGQPPVVLQVQGQPADSQEARVVRDQLRDLFRRYPPELGIVLKLDPTLLTNAAYLAPYPDLAAFLTVHPEIARYPSYFLSFVNEPSQPVPADVQLRREAISMWRSTQEMLSVVLVFIVGFLVLAWLIRLVVSHRRWLRATRIQADLHNRLLERFSTNAELLAYMQSPAAAQFLRAVPAVPDVEPAPTSLKAPFARILWAVQGGLILVSGGIGLLVVRRYLIGEIGGEQVGGMLLTLGVLGVSLGLGFILASGAAYVISRRLGLLEPPPAAELRGAEP